MYVPMSFKSKGRETLEYGIMNITVFYLVFLCLPEGSQNGSSSRFCYKLPCVWSYHCIEEALLLAHVHVYVSGRYKNYRALYS